jgi:RNA polymerase sigma-70 factor (ECF subfamily)
MQLSTQNCPITEAHLVSLLRCAQSNRDPEALDELYQRYAHRIMRYLVTRAKDTELAEDVCAQVFLRMIEKIHLYTIAPKDNTAIFSAWLYRIAYNCLVDTWRRQRQVSIVSLDSIYTVHAPMPELDLREESAAKNPEEMTRVNHTLNMLNTQQRQVIVLRFVEGLSVQQTAEALDKEPSAIRMIQHRAVKNLRRLLTPVNYSASPSVYI